MRLTARRAFAGAAVLLATACGLTAVGERASPTGDDAVAEAGTPHLPDGHVPDATPQDDAAPDAGADTSFDAQGRCLEVCDAGTCDDAGTCTIDCTGVGACGGRVVCPPDVACAVRCIGTGACTQGVDCTQAGACDVDCSGTGACTNQDVRCAGASCDVRCDGTGSCTQGVSCDAGTCAIGCTGTSSCQNQPVSCHASTCRVQCGADAGGQAGKDSCSQSVVCTAAKACDVACVAADTCKNAPVRATAAAVEVRCVDEKACSAGVALAGEDAGVVCRKDGACGPAIYCDAGKCAAACAPPENPSAQLCCAPGSTCELDASACDPNAFKIGCP